MSESAVILEGEVARRFNPVDKLRATNQDSSVSDWVPSDTLDLGNLMASENNLYLANIDDDCDAYEEVEVDVSTDLEDADDETKATKKITGTGSDGNDYAVGLDENGNLTSEMVPSAIHIVIKPRKLEYEDGETLDFTGIHVYLMDGNNHRFTSEAYPTGEIPFDELIFPVTTADESEASGEEYDYGEYRDSGTVEVTSAGSISALIEQELGYFQNGYEDPNGCVELIKTVTASNDGIHPCICYVYNGEGPYEGYSPFDVFVFYTINVGDVVNLGRSYPCYRYYTWGKMPRNGVMKITQEYYTEFSNIIYTGQYPNTTNISTLNAIKISEGGQTIPVQWIRSDGKTLEDSFSIAVISGET